MSGCRCRPWRRRWSSETWCSSWVASRDALVGLRLRRAARRLAERAHDRAPRQLDLEVVVTVAARAGEQRLRGAGEILAAGPFALERDLRVAIAPRLVGDAAER